MRNKKIIYLFSIVLLLLVVIVSFLVLKNNKNLSYLENNVEAAESYNNYEKFTLPFQFYEFSNQNYIIDLTSYSIYKVDDKFKLIESIKIKDLINENQSPNLKKDNNYIRGIVKFSDSELLLLVNNNEDAEQGSELIKLAFDNSGEIKELVTYPSFIEAASLMLIDNSFKDKLQFEDNMSTEDIENINLDDYISINGIFFRRTELDSINDKLNTLFETSPNYTNQIEGIFAVLGGSLPSSNSSEIYLDTDDVENSNQFTIYNKQGKSFNLTKSNLNVDDYLYFKAYLIKGNKLINILKSDSDMKLALYDLDSEKTTLIKKDEKYEILGLFEKDNDIYYIYSKDRKVNIDKINL